MFITAVVFISNYGSDLIWFYEDEQSDEYELRFLDKHFLALHK